MRTTSILGALALVLGSLSTGFAQQGGSLQSGSAGSAGAGVYFPPPIYSSGGSYFSPATTAVEGAFRGAGALVQAQGEYNYNTGAGLVNLENAISKDVVNRQMAVEGYFTMKKINESYRTALRGPKPSPEQLAQIAHITAPRRLTAYQLDPSTGAINWPAILQRSEFDAYRKRLEDLFAQRDANNSGLGTENYDEIVYVVSQLEQDLKGVIDRITPAEYVTAKRFLNSLQYEAKFTPGVEAVVNSSR